MLMDGIRGVYDTSCPVLTDGKRTLDITAPIRFGRHWVGTYHSGVNWNWLQREIKSAQNRSLRIWSLVIGGIVIVVLLSSVSLYWITRRSARLKEELETIHARHAEEFSQLMVGLAHEIRNPMNAIQLNLFTADRVFRGEVDLDRDEVMTMLDESVREVERIDELISLLLSYARTGADVQELVDVKREIDAIEKFLGPTFASRGIELVSDLRESEAYVQAGRGHVRQVLLNLLNNARDAVPRDRGRIRLELHSDPREVQVSVLDNGPGVAPDARERIFAPFYSTKENGTGLGLAIVRQLMEMSGGAVKCGESVEGGCCFSVSWPAVTVLREQVTAV